MTRAMHCQAAETEERITQQIHEAVEFAGAVVRVLCKKPGRGQDGKYYQGHVK